jgi:hypothetical protein
MICREEASHISTPTFATDHSVGFCAETEKMNSGKSWKDIGRISPHAVYNSSVRILHPHRTIGQFASLDGQMRMTRSECPEAVSDRCAKRSRIPLEEFVAQFFWDGLAIGMQGWIEICPVGRDRSAICI